MLREDSLEGLGREFTDNANWLGARVCIALPVPWICLIEELY